MDRIFEKRIDRVVIGTDEAGRGPLAGPVKAAAVRIDSELDFDDLKEVDDSKKLSKRKREELYLTITSHPEIEWSVSWVSPSVIDRINILEATKVAMKRVVGRVSKRDELVLVDGQVPFKSSLEQLFLRRGDQRAFACAAASILAKVFRDRTMLRYHKQWPQYGFDQHKGYPTIMHKEMIEKYGLTRIHRRSFRPCREGLKSVQ